MSKTNSLHYDLCLKGAKWLRSTHNHKYPLGQRPNDKLGYYRGFKWVTVELVVCCAENCDIWGFDGFYTAVIEVKTSHADFLADKKKWWRNTEKEWQAGNLRWYLCPKDIIKPEELPEGWGLLYWQDNKIIPIIAPLARMDVGHADLRILYSLLRREGFKEGIYNYREKACELLKEGKK